MLPYMLRIRGCRNKTSTSFCSNTDARFSLTMWCSSYVCFVCVVSVLSGVLHVAPREGRAHLPHMPGNTSCTSTSLSLHTYGPLNTYSTHGIARQAVQGSRLVHTQWEGDHTPKRAYVYSPSPHHSSDLPLPLCLVTRRRSRATWACRRCVVSVWPTPRPSVRVWGATCPTPSTNCQTTSGPADTQSRFICSSKR